MDMKSQLKVNKNTSVRGKVLIVDLISVLIIVTIWAAFLDVIVLLKTEVMAGKILGLNRRPGQLT